MQYKPGDIVKLKSGSALMTVESFNSLSGRWVCVWHDKNEERRGEYLEATLEAAERPAVGVIARPRQQRFTERF
jgi:uncharacterized protein YodC (DUF2158 family)